MKLTLFLDQIQAGLGTKDDKMMTLGGKTTAIGPALMMENSLKLNGIIVNACLYCGDGYFQEHKDEVVLKLVAMVDKLQSDVVLCGPAFDFNGYATMACQFCLALNKAGHKAFVALAEEKNEELIDTYKEQMFMVKMPKKGGVGLNASLENMANFALSLYKNENIEELKQELCY